MLFAAARDPIRTRKCLAELRGAQRSTPRLGERTECPRLTKVTPERLESS